MGKTTSPFSFFGKYFLLRLRAPSAKNGVGYGAWHHIDGFSEACVDYIQEFERVSD